MHQSVKLFLVFLCLLVPCIGQASPTVERYGVVLQEIDVSTFTRQSFDSLIRSSPMLISTKNARVEHFRIRKDGTFNLYTLIAIVLFFGLIHYNNQRYFHNLWRAFRNPELSHKHLKDQIVSAGWTSVVMNVFFFISAGTYLYYLSVIFLPQRLVVLPPSMLLLLLIVAVMVVYVVKYIIIRFSGWIFNFKMVADNYLFNVFLINKVIAILLLPIIVLIAFTGTAIQGPVVIVSFVLVGLLLLNRYMRSWQVMGSVFQYNRFHFFTYLCASELLPMAVLIKMLTRIIYY